MGMVFLAINQPKFKSLQEFYKQFMPTLHKILEFKSCREILQLRSNMQYGVKLEWAHKARSLIQIVFLRQKLTFFIFKETPAIEW